MSQAAAVGDLPETQSVATVTGRAVPSYAWSRLPSVTVAEAFETL